MNAWRLLTPEAWRAPDDKKGLQECDQTAKFINIFIFIFYGVLGWALNRRVKYVMKLHLLLQIRLSKTK